MKSITATIATTCLLATSSLVSARTYLSTWGGEGGGVGAGQLAGVGSTWAWCLVAFKFGVQVADNNLLTHNTRNITPEMGYKNGHPLTNLPASHEDVETAYVFVDNAKKSFPAGELASVLMSFSNTGEETLNVTGIMGSINSPMDFGIYVQNFTYHPYGRVANPGTQMTLEYGLKPDVALHPRDFTIALTVFYESKDSGTSYATTFFNDTVAIAEPKSSFDLQTLTLYLSMLGIIGAIGNRFYGSVAKKITPKPTAKKSSTSSGSDANEWLKGTSADPTKKSKSDSSAKQRRKA